jgi:peptidoglycan/xylan/chitin deacetylase (PgdA/CDA1 family)
LAERLAIIGDLMKGRKICLSIDAEFWDSPQFFGLSEEKNTEHGNRGCQKILDLFDQFKIKTTFFVATEFAQQHPATIHRVIRAGHELASHSCSHVRFDRLESVKRSFEIDESKRFLEERFGILVKGFRSPGNLIEKDHFLLLKKAGYQYDSSLHPALLPHRPFDLFKSESPFDVDGVVEVPISTLAGLPVSWVFMRNSGLWLARLAVYYNRLRGRDVVLYFHSWDFEPLPAVRGLPRYVTRATGRDFLAMIANLIIEFKKKAFHFCRMDELVDEYIDHHSGL